MFQKVGIVFTAIAVLTVRFPAFAQENGESAQPPATTESAEPAGSVFAKDTFSIRTIVCPFKGQIKYKPGEISCGLLKVPENREKARPREIELHFVKIHAKKPDDWDAGKNGEWKKRDDPIIYLTGGPGAKASYYVKRLKDHGVRDTRDLYILEQRGIGWSGDYCPLYANFDPAASNTPDWDKYQRAGLEAMEACFSGAKAAHIDLSAYNTIENARDVEALRRALGFETWNVWGISYGAILGQAYLKQDPEGIRAVVIDAITPLQQDITFHHIAQYYDRDLTTLTQACAADPKCATAFPDFKGRLEAAIMKVAMRPIEVDAIDKELFPTGKGYFFQDLVGALPFLLFYEQDNYATIPAFIDAFVRLVEDENYAPFKLLTVGGGGDGFVPISQGMYDAIACNDYWLASMKKAYEEDFTDYPALAMLFGDPALVDEQARLCRRYGLDPRPADDYAAVKTNVRALLIEGAMDPITPPPLAKMALPGFSNATYVEFPYAGHGPSRSVECAGEFLTNFFDDPEGDLDMSCPNSMEAPKFAGRLFETNAITKLGAMAAEDPKTLVVPALWLLLPTLIFVFGALVYTFAPVARLINGAPGHPTGGARLIAWATALLGAAAIGGLGYAAYASYDANELLLLVGLLGWARWFALAGFAAGALGLWLIWMTIKARMRAPLPIGVLDGLLLTGAAGVALASWLAVWGLLPF